MKALVLPFYVRPLEIRLDAKHQPFVPLPVVANLATTNESAWIRMKALRRKVKERGGIRERMEVCIAIPRAVTAVATEVETGPSVIALWRCRCGLFHSLAARQRLEAGQKG